ncbi:unnamed protein product [Jaminaea pallidilutea]
MAQETTTTAPEAANSAAPSLEAATAASADSLPLPRVFLPPSASSSASASSSTPLSSASTTTPNPSQIRPPPPDEDPKPTAAELQAAYASTIQRNQRSGIGPEAPLMTQSMREKHEAKFQGPPKKTFNEIRVRIRLPDQTILEYQLPSTFPLLRLYTLLDASLVVPGSDSSSSPPAFTLYTSPPRVEFPRDPPPPPKPLPVSKRSYGAGANKPAAPAWSEKKIGDMGWGGASLVNVKWADEALNSRGAVQPIKPELKAKAETLEPPKMGITDGDGGGAGSGAAGGAGRTLGGGGNSSGRDEGTGEKKVPKWFKGFKK